MSRSSPTDSPFLTSSHGFRTFGEFRRRHGEARVRDLAGQTKGPPWQRVPGEEAGAGGSFWRESLAAMEKYLVFNRRRVDAGEAVYHCGDAFNSLFLINTGLFKVVNLSVDGREQPAGLYFKGDWLGFDGIPTRRYSCSAIALDSGELWHIRYADLLQASAREPALLRVVLAALSGQLAKNRDAMLAMGTLCANARVADFLLKWAQSLAERGLRTDQINVHMTRADIGHHLGLTLESVSRALSKLARCGVIQFRERGRREVSIPNLDVLARYVQSMGESKVDTVH